MLFKNNYTWFSRTLGESQNVQFMIFWLRLQDLAIPVSCGCQDCALLRESLDVDSTILPSICHGNARFVPILYATPFYSWMGKA